MKLPALLATLAAFTLPASAQKMQTKTGEAPGPWILGTIGVGKGEDAKTPKETALKGLAIKVGAKGEAAVAYDLDLCRMVGAWTGKFTTPMNLMSRGEFPTALGEVAFTTGAVPGFQSGADLQSAGAGGGERGADLQSAQAGGGKMVAAGGSQTASLRHTFGPLPPGQARFKGFYVNGDKTILKWDIGGTEVLEMPGYLVRGEFGYFYRAFSIGLHRNPIRLPLSNFEGVFSVRTLITRPNAVAPPWADFHSRLVTSKDEKTGIFWSVFGDANASELEGDEQNLVKRQEIVLPEKPDKTWLVAIGSVGERFALEAARDALDTAAQGKGEALEFPEPENLVIGGPARWPELVVTQGELAKDTTAAYVVDTIKLPDPNPWGAPMFTSGFDFFEDGRAAVCTFHGDVFVVSGIDEKLEHVTWRRFASGLYHPLGLKIVKGEIYVTCRDGIWRLRDLNGDGECDFYEAFNFDLKVTKNFHEFVFDLQTDPAGNFYFAKAGPVKNGGRGFDEIMSQHGTLMRVSPDGAQLDVIATGFRAPNGIGVGPHGELTSGDNEGTWTPACKINWIKPGGFYGVVDLAHGFRGIKSESDLSQHSTPPYDRPLCWLPKRVDNSGGGQVWVPEGDRWGPWGGKMLHLSYGQAALYGVLMEEVQNSKLPTQNSAVQGGVTKFPLKFQTGIMRGRFNPKDGQLYVTGLRGWQTIGLKNGAFQRVRYTGTVARMPIAMHVKKDGIEIQFTCTLDTQSARDPENWRIEQWRYLWSGAYGSPEYSTEGDLDSPGESGKDGFSKDRMAKTKHDPVTVKSVTIGTDDRTVFLEIPGLKPVMQMSIKYDLKTSEAQELRGEIVNTIHALGGE